jgi:hypothetical protein
LGWIDPDGDGRVALAGQDEEKLKPRLTGQPSDLEDGW